MTELSERLDGVAHLRGSLVRSHLAWADEKIPDSKTALAQELSAEHRQLVERPVLASLWVPFASVVALDRAIASVLGGNEKEIYASLGRASARHNLAGSYRIFQDPDPHRFFEKSATLHGHYQDFGSATYSPEGERKGLFSIGDCAVYSPVHCAGELGYLRESLLVLSASDNPHVEEMECCCAGQGACVFAVGW